MCEIKLAACLSVFQCKSSIVSYRIVSCNWKLAYVLYVWIALRWTVHFSCNLSAIFRQMLGGNDASSHLAGAVVRLPWRRWQQALKRRCRVWLRNGACRDRHPTVRHSLAPPMYSPCQQQQQQQLYQYLHTRSMIASLCVHNVAAPFCVLQAVSKSLLCFCPWTSQAATNFDKFWLPRI